MRFLFLCCLLLAAAQHCEEQLQCFDPTCGTPLKGRKVLAPCECTEDDIGFEYSECDPELETRQIVYFWKPPANCQGGVSLPAPIDGIPCDMGCSIGTFMDVSVSPPVCKPCRAGTYSAGGGVEIDTPWNEIPPQFTTECIPDGDPFCSPWQAQGEYLDSGENFEYDNIMSILAMHVNLEVDGFVKFEYKWDGEELFDEFLFLVDGVTKKTTFNRLADWEQLMFELPRGYHQLRWIHKKDPSLNMYTDRAYVRRIEIKGLNRAELTCSPCPLGKFAADDEQEFCEPCPANTYSENTGATFCEPCEPGELSYPGSSYCVPQSPCGVADYGSTSTQCVDARRTVTYQWLQPRTCSDSLEGSVSLPDPVEVDCEISCASGMQMSSTGVCAYCVPGTATLGGLDSCQDCEAGSAASDIMRHFTEWPTLPEEFTTGCTGDCGTDGWRAGGQFVDSGGAHGSQTSVFLDMNVPIRRPAEVVIDYSLSCDVGSGRMEIFVNGSQALSLNCASCSAEKRSHVLAVPSMASRDMDVVHNIRFVYHKVRHTGMDQSCDGLKIFAIHVNGAESDKGAAKCEECPAGYYSDHKAPQCSACPVGQANPQPGQSSCSPCVGSTFSHSVGSHKCRECGDGTWPSADHSTCDTNCTLELASADGDVNIYDLKAYSELMGVNGPIVHPLNKSFEFFFTTCEPFPADHPCHRLHYDGEWSTIEAEHVDDARLIPSFACMVKEGSKATSLGSIMSLLPLEDGVSVALSQGSLCSDRDGGGDGNGGGSGDGSGGGGGPRRDAQIDYVCADESTATGVTLDASKSVGCHTHFTVETPLACPLCDEKDYSSSVSPCSKSDPASAEYFEETMYFWRSPRRCHGGQLPPPFRSTCTPQAVVPEGSMVVSSAIVGMAVAGSAVFVIGAIYTVVLYFKYRRVYNSYSQLQAGGGDLPMPMNMQEDDD